MEEPVVTGLTGRANRRRLALRRADAAIRDLWVALRDLDARAGGLPPICEPIFAALMTHPAVRRRLELREPKIKIEVPDSGAQVGSEGETNEEG